MTTRVGFVGWRGMVGSVLLHRLREENDFDAIDPVFFSTSSPGGPSPSWGTFPSRPLQNAYDLDTLATLPIIVTTQGSHYTQTIHHDLRARGWQGLWIDAASTLRMKDRSIIVLDPVNRASIDEGLARGIRDFVGGNCTVSCMLMALAGLFRPGLVEWGVSMTYQAASGGGARHMRELLQQFGSISSAVSHELDNPAVSILDLDRTVLKAQRQLDSTAFHVPLAGSLIPWIDSDIGTGQSREEWKNHAETNKILAPAPPVVMDGLCVRVGALRAHSQALTLKLKQPLTLTEISDLIERDNPWATVIPNTLVNTQNFLTPIAVSGTLTLAVGRLRHLAIGPEYISVFTVGDQLLWGAAEPLRRMLAIALGRL